MNYTERLRDVSTLAHEFGHATHNVLSLEQQTWRSHRTGIPMAEVPSTFAQALADDYLLENEADLGTRAALAADRLENAFAAIYRQTVLARFEQRAYALRSEGRSLGVERLNELWVEENGKYYGDALVMPEGYAYGWSYIPHFIHVRFYTYAYSFAQLVALLLVPALPPESRVVRSEVPRAARGRRHRLAGRPRRAVRARSPLGRHLARGVRGARRPPRRSRHALDAAYDSTRHVSVGLASGRARPAAPAALPRLRSRRDAALPGLHRAAAAADAAALRAVRRADGMAGEALPRVRGPKDRVRHRPGRGRL